MATEKKKRKTTKRKRKRKPKKKSPYPDNSGPSPFGRPTKYKKIFCKMLVEHMATGQVLNTFGTLTEVNVSSKRVGEWKKKYPDFQEAVERGIDANLEYQLKVANQGIRGSAVRLASEKPVLTQDKEGNTVPLLDANQKIVTEKTYIAAKYTPSTHIFLLSNFHGMTHRHVIEPDKKESIFSPRGKEKWLSDPKNVAQVESVFRELMAASVEGEGKSD